MEKLTIKRMKEVNNLLAYSEADVYTGVKNRQSLLEGLQTLIEECQAGETVKKDIYIHTGFLKSVTFESAETLAEIERIFDASADEVHAALTVEIDAYYPDEEEAPEATPEKAPEAAPEKALYHSVSGEIRHIDVTPSPTEFKNIRAVIQQNYDDVDRVRDSVDNCDDLEPWEKLTIDNCLADKMGELAKTLNEIDIYLESQN